MATTNFIQGGQIARHNFKMFMQVVNTVKFIVFICFLGFFVAKTWKDTNYRDWYVSYEYYIARVNINIPFQNEFQVSQEYEYESGTVAQIRSYDIVYNDYIDSTKEKLKNTLVRNAFFALFFSMIICLISTYFFKFHGARKSRKIIKSGNKIVSPKKLARILRKDNMASDIEFAGMPLVKNSEVRHMSVTGSNGSGKTNFIHHLLPQIRARGDKVFIIDTSGGFVERFYNEETDIIFNPFDKRSVSWDIWSECNNIGQYDLLTEACIPPNSRLGEGDFWHKAGSSLFSVALKKMKIIQPDRKYRIEELHQLFSRAPLGSFCSFFKHTDGASIASMKSDKTTDNIRSHARTNIQWLKYLDCEHDPFSFRQWVSDEKNNGWAFITSNADSMTTLSPLISAIFTVTTNELMRLGPNNDRRVWFIIDELTSLTKMPKLEESIKLLRKYGGCVVAGFQNIYQMYNVYGQNESKSILSQFNNKAFFKEDQPETTKYIAETIGKIRDS